jgi:hypothetical protein
MLVFAVIRTSTGVATLRDATNGQQSRTTRMIVAMAALPTSAVRW